MCRMHVQALNRGYGALQPKLQQLAVTALQALGSMWPHAVIGTAAAISADSAMTACAQRLISEVSIASLRLTLVAHMVSVGDQQ